MLTGWAAPKRSSPGGQALYPDLAIEFVLTLRLMFHLALRQAEAFACSVLRLLELSLSAPDHSTSSRRGRAFAGRQPRVPASAGPVYLVLDSIGVVPLHRGFDCLSVSGIERGQVGAVYLDGDAPSRAGVA